MASVIGVSILLLCTLSVISVAIAAKFGVSGASTAILSISLVRSNAAFTWGADMAISASIRTCEAATSCVGALM